MARLIGVDLPREKRLAIALTYIYGVGRSQAAKALQATGIDPSMKAKDMMFSQIKADINAATESLLFKKITADDLKPIAEKRSSKKKPTLMR